MDRSIISGFLYIPSAGHFENGFVAFSGNVGLFLNKKLDNVSASLDNRLSLFKRRVDERTSIPLQNERADLDATL